MRIVVLVLILSVSVFPMDRPPRLEKNTPPYQPSRIVECGLDFFKLPEFYKLLDQGTPISWDDIECLASRTLYYKQYFFWLRQGKELLLKANIVSDRVPSLKAQAARAALKATDEKKYNLLPAELRRLVISNDFEKTIAEFKLFFNFDSASQISDPRMKKIIDAKKLEQRTQLWGMFLDYESIPFAIRVLKKLRESFKKFKDEPREIGQWTQQLVARICTQVLQVTQFLRQKGILDPLVAGLEREYTRQINNLRAIGTDVSQMEELKRDT